MKATIKRLLGLAILVTAPLTHAASVDNRPSNLSSLPSVIDEALNTFHTPGMAVGIIKDDKIVYLAGHGKRNIELDLPVTESTYFRLASTSKAFTALSLAMMIEEKELTWQEPVTSLLPQFQMQDPWVTREFTLLDLLTHRSGLPGGAGDSMLWPEPSGFSRAEIIHNLRYLTPTSSFRSQYGYSNLLFITAGELVAGVRQQPWDVIIEQSIMTPLDMTCFAGDIPAQYLSNVAMSYGHNDEKGIYPIPRNQISKSKLVSAAAGGVVCNAQDMLKWVSMWLNNGITPDGTQLVSEKTLAFMQSPQMLLSVSETDEDWDNTLFKAYGLGWRLSDVYGKKVVSHTGTLSGYQAYVAMVPEIDLGIVLLNNGSNSGARGSVMQHIVKAYLTEHDTQNWVANYVEYQQEREARYLARHSVPKGNAEVILDLLAYQGNFEDKWFGNMTVKMENDALRITSSKMPTLTGTLEPFIDHSFVIRWDNQNAASDAFIHYQVSTDRQVTGFTLAPFTNRPSTNHEWRDMVFYRQEVQNNTDKSE